MLTMAVEDGKTVVVPMTVPAPMTAVGVWLAAETDTAIPPNRYRILVNIFYSENRI